MNTPDKHDPREPDAVPAEVAATPETDAEIKRHTDAKGEIAQTEFDEFARTLERRCHALRSENIRLVCQKTLVERELSAAKAEVEQVHVILKATNERLVALGCQQDENGNWVNKAATLRSQQPASDPAQELLEEAGRLANARTKLKAARGFLHDVLAYFEDATSDLDNKGTYYVEIPHDEYEASLVPFLKRIEAFLGSPESTQPPAPGASAAVRDKLASIICTHYGDKPNDLEPGNSKGVDGDLNGEPCHFRFRDFYNEADAILEAFPSLLAPTTTPGACAAVREKTGHLIQALSRISFTNALDESALTTIKEVNGFLSLLAPTAPANGSHLDLASIADFINIEARECGVAECKLDLGDVKVCIMRVIDKARATAPASGEPGDGELLDWLEKNGNRMYSWVCDWTQNGATLLRLRQSTAAFPCTPREAIDAAMTAQRANGGKE